jgi:hypothetical protein
MFCPPPTLVFSFTVLPVLLSSSTVSCTALKTQHSCDKINLIESSAGQILSPSRDYGNGNISYPSRVNCAWYIKIQPGSVITLRWEWFSNRFTMTPDRPSNILFSITVSQCLTWKKGGICAAPNPVVVIRGSQYWAFRLTLPSLFQCLIFLSKTQSIFSTVVPCHCLH